MGPYGIGVVDPYKYNGKEWSEVLGLGWYFYGFRMHDPAVGRFSGVDPLAEKYAAWSTYHYTLNNPILFVDPDGRSVESTIVTANDDGTYKVVGGNANDGDNGIYLVDWESGKVGLVGYSATPESFYFSENDEWLGTIDPTDQSGKNFLNEQIIGDNPSVGVYMARATGGQPLDFKRTNGTNEVMFDTPEEFYRGMPLLGDKDGKPIYASARDVGNVAAGLVAGRSGMGWSTARLGYDGLESIQQGGFSSESTSTQYGQKLGHRIGYQMFQKYEQSRLPGSGHLRNVKISRDVVKKGDL